MRAWVVVDFETRSAVDIDVGPECYAADDTTDALCIAWQWPDGAKHVVDADASVTVACDELFAHQRAGGIVVVHNASFELAISAMLHRRKPDVWPALTIEQTHCTMAMARTLALPGSLENLANVLRLPVRKDMEGSALMKRMAKPAKLTAKQRKAIAAGADPITEGLTYASGHYWHDTPELRVRLRDYCLVDVEAQVAAWLALPKLPASERALWVLDQRINQRGVGIDREACRRARDLLAGAAERLDAELVTLTGGAVSSARAAAALRTWLAEQGTVTENMQKHTVETAVLTATGPAKRALEIRLAVSKSSTAKLTPMLDMTQANGRARNTLQFHRATTGRWAGSGIQTQNLSRPPKGWKVKHAEEFIAALKAGDDVRLATIFEKWGGEFNTVAASLRSMLCAAPGWRLMAADYSNIEGRGLAWLAGEQWKLDAFRQYDTVRLDASGVVMLDAKGESMRVGSDLYKLAFAKAFGIAVDDVDEYQRQVGKVMELALGYAGSVGAFLSMGANYNIDLALIATIARRAVDAETWDNACAAYDRISYDPDAAEETELEDDNEDYSFLEPFKGDPRRGLPREQWAAIRCIVQGWRSGHPATVAWWKSLESAAIAAVDAWGTTHAAGPVVFSASRTALRCRLPSGRHLTYPFARVIRGESRKTGKLQTVLLYSAAKGASRTWRPTRAYGGLLSENITQAVARDALAHALITLERSGYATIMHVHDEIVVEMPDGVGSASEFQALCEAAPAWAQGLPLVTGEPWEGQRYRK